MSVFSTFMHLNCVLPNDFFAVGYFLFVVNERKYHAIKGEMESNEKAHGEIVTNLMKRLDAFQDEKRSMLDDLNEQKVTYLKTNNLQFNHLFNNMRIFEDQIKTKNSTIDNIVTNLNSLYESLASIRRESSQNNQTDMGVSTVVDEKLIEDYQRLSYQVNSLETTTVQLIATVDKLHAENDVVIAYKKLNQNIREHEPALSTQVLELKAQIERLNKTVFGQNFPVTAIFGGECSRTKSGQSKFKRTIRKSFSSMIHHKANNNLGTMVSILKCNLTTGETQAQPYSRHLPDPSGIIRTNNSNHDNSSASSSGKAITSTIKATSTSTVTEAYETAATTATSIPILESRIDELCSSQAKMNDQIKYLIVKLDNLPTKSKKSTTTTTIRDSLSFGKSKRNSNSSDEQIDAIRKHLDSLHREFNGAKGRYRDNILMIQDELAKSKEKQKLQEESAEHYRKKHVKFSNYAQNNIHTLSDTSTRQQALLDSLASTLEQLESVLTKDFQCLFPNKQQCGTEEQKHSSMKFIDRLCASLIYDRAILESNCERLKTLTSKLDSASGFKKVVDGLLHEQVELDDKVKLELQQVEEIKVKCAAQASKAALILAEKKGHFLHQYMEFHEKAIELNIKIMCVCPEQTVPL
ncbi:hypothetical protein BD408DRAFT_436446 [Parasitella parasitica]|nr:hypothetical protein BD408DRAFT_436446 [Parasitella parasitica]